MRFASVKKPAHNVALDRLQMLNPQDRFKKKFEEEFLTDRSALVEALVLPDILTKVAPDPAVVMNINKKAHPQAGNYLIWNFLKRSPPIK